MGSCVSKCCLIRPRHDHPVLMIPPEDKLVVSQSPLPPKQQPPPDPPLLTTSSSLLSSSTPPASSISTISTVSSSSTLPTSSTSTTSTVSSCSSSSAYTLTVRKPYTDNFLRSCAKENPHIVILDPHKYDTASKLRPAPPPRRNEQVRLSTKRERSVSPQRSAAQWRSSKGTEAKPAPIREPLRASSSPSHMIHSSPSNYNARKYHKPTNENAGRSERPRPSSPLEVLNKPSSEETRSKDPIADDIDNPLISMECFIFL